MENELKLRPPSEIFAHGCSPSMMQLWQLCPRKWWLHYVVKEGRDEKESQKDAGIAVHKALQGYYANETEGDILARFEKDFPEAQSDDKRSSAHVKNVLKGYFARYSRSSEPFRILSLEQATQVPIEGCAVPLNIKVDAIIEWMNGLWVMDHKTTNFLGATFFEQFRHNWQTYTYIYGVEKSLLRKCEGILYNAIGFKQKIDNDSFLRKEFAKTKDQMKYHMGNWVNKVNELYEYVNKNWEDVEKFSMNPGNACRAYNVNCPFLDYCEFNGNNKLLN